MTFSELWREGKGDFFLGCMLMAEVSTPRLFVWYKKQDTLLHRLNGVVMLVTFFLLPPAAVPLHVLGVRAAGGDCPSTGCPSVSPRSKTLARPSSWRPRAYSLFQQCRMSQRPRNGHPVTDSPSAKDQDCSQ
ncbi:unnamed protein product [Ranitomeya imitator]|uniref:Uncharacterized protein n=1 Tax=Ranitomeya imitator TaxID=111125 RepID=A0ABN9MAW6_9NEOB|nr:unnamed protein product [Ranitomeya imitator]